MCHIWKKENCPDTPVDQWGKILRSPLFRDVEILLLTGGEPFLMKDFVERTLLAAQGLPHLKIIAVASNGILKQKIADDINALLKSLPKKILISIAVSIDGLERTHDAIRGLPGVYTKAIETFTALQKIARHHKNLTIGIETVINRHNADSLDQIESHHRKLTTHFNFTPAITSDYYQNDSADFTITTAQKNTVINFYKHLMRRSPHLAYFYNHAIRFIVSGERHYPCLGGILTARLNPDGALFPCLMLNNKIAAADQNYERMWFHGPFAKFRKTQLHVIGYCRHCLNSCDMMNNYYYEVFDVLRFYARHPLITLRFAAQFLKDMVQGGYYSQMTKNR